MDFKNWKKFFFYPDDEIMRKALSVSSADEFINFIYQKKKDQLFIYSIACLIFEFFWNKRNGKATALLTVMRKIEPYFSWSKIKEVCEVVERKKAAKTEDREIVSYVFWEMEHFLTPQEKIDKYEGPVFLVLTIGVGREKAEKVNAEIRGNRIKVKVCAYLVGSYWVCWCQGGFFSVIRWHVKALLDARGNYLWRNHNFQTTTEEETPW